MIKISNSLIYLVPALFLFILGILPFFHSDFFPMHDDTQPSRVQQMAESLRSGQFPVRWVGDLGYGYGYPLFNFYAPLPYYLGACFYLFGFTAITSAKIMILIPILLSGVFMFILIKQLAGNSAAVLSSLLYIYAPYHAVNIYVRGAVGELYAYAFFPLFFFGITKLIRVKELKIEDVKIGILTTTLGFAAILLSHNILGMITSIIAVFILIIFALWMVINRFTHLTSKRKKRNYSNVFFLLLFCFILTFSVSAFFTLPAFLEKSYTRVDQLIKGGSDFRDHFVFPDQLWNSPWGFAGSAPGRQDGMSFKIGKVHLILGVLGFTNFLYQKLKEKIKLRLSVIYIISFIFFIFSVFMMLKLSQPFWELLPILSFIQYPWRFQNITLFSLSILSSALFIGISKKYKLTLAVIGIAAVLVFNLKYFNPQTRIPVGDEDYISPKNLRNKISRISDEYLSKDFVIPQTEHGIVYAGLADTSSLRVKQLINTPTRKTYDVYAQKNTPIISQIAYFPGWEVIIDEKKAEIISNKGRIQFDIEQGTHFVEFIFMDTPVRKISNTISFLSLLLLVYVSLKPRGPKLLGVFLSKHRR